MFNHFEIMREVSPPASLSNEQLKGAIDSLAESIELVADVLRELGGSVFNMLLLAEKCEQAWNAMNRCRVYTEKIIFLEELIYPAMGLVNDARCMINSLVAWKLGMTKPGYLNICGCLNATEIALRTCVDEMVGWMKPEENEQDLSSLIRSVAF